MANKKGLTEEQIEEMRFMEDELQMTRTKIAKEMGISNNTVKYYLGSRYVTHMPNKIGPEEIREMNRLREKGLSNSKIAIEMHLSKSTVNRHMGRQPTAVRAEYGSIVAHVTGESFVKQKEESKLKKLSTKIQFEGDQFQYEADNAGFLQIKLPSGIAVGMDINQFDNFIKELNELQAWFERNCSAPAYLLDGKPKSQKKPLLL